MHDWIEYSPTACYKCRFGLRHGRNHCAHSSLLPHFYRMTGLHCPQTSLPTQVMFWIIYLQDMMLNLMEGARGALMQPLHGLLMQQYHQRFLIPLRKLTRPQSLKITKSQIYRLPLEQKFNKCKSRT